MNTKIDSYKIRALELAAQSEIGADVMVVLDALSQAGSLAAGGDVDADPQRARRLLSKLLREIAAGIEVTANAVDRNG